MANRGMEQEETRAGRGQIPEDTVDHGKAVGYFIKKGRGHGTQQGHASLGERLDRLETLS